MTTKYTPGPWEYGKTADEIYFVSSKNDYLCFLFAGEQEEQEEANARLIAAAPELLQVAEKALEVLDRVSSEYGLTDSQLIAYTNLINVIAKARLT